MMAPISNRELDKKINNQIAFDLARKKFESIDCSDTEKMAVEYKKYVLEVLNCLEYNDMGKHLSI